MRSPLTGQPRKYAYVTLESTQAKLARCEYINSTTEVQF
jgi:hypothetical protein